MFWQTHYRVFPYGQFLWGMWEAQANPPSELTIYRVDGVIESRYSY